MPLAFLAVHGAQEGIRVIVILVQLVVRGGAEPRLCIPPEVASILGRESSVTANNHGANTVPVTIKIRHGTQRTTPRICGVSKPEQREKKSVFIHLQNVPLTIAVF